MATTKITSPDLFDLGSLTTALQLPNGTTAERPTSPSTGEWRYNTTTNLVEFWDGGEWRDLQSEDIPPTPSEHFNVVLYTGNGATNAITGVGFKPDFVWLKERNGTNWNTVFDSTRGADYRIFTNSTDAQSSPTSSLTSFDSDGFTLGSNANENSNGNTYVAWCWKANGGTTSSNTDGSDNSTVQVNTQAGFSIVQYTATTATSSSTAGHGLGTTPAMIILKSTSAVEDWYIWHKDLGAGSSALNQYLRFTTASQATATNLFGTVNDTVFATAYTGSVPNTNVAYCFAEKAEYSKFGSYTGNGSANGPIVNTGFEPAYIMIKNSTAVYEWTVYDNKRSPSNPRDEVLYPNTSGAENSGETGDIDFLTNGFQLKAADGSINQNGGTIIYAAFASDASAAPVLADSFTSATYSGNNGTQSIAGLGFAPSLTWIKNRSSAASHSWTDIMRGNNQVLQSNETVSQASGQITLDSDGFTLGSSNVLRNEGGQTYVSWNWKAAALPAINTDGTDTSIVSANVAAGFSIAILPDKAGSQNLGHGLDGVPDLIIMKQYEGGTGGWTTYNSVVGVRNYMNLNTNAGNTVATAGYEYDAVTATTITNLISGSTYSYIYYCFKNVAGFSKVGSYSGNSSTQSITGLGFQPSWVMLKRYDGTENWYVQDSARGSTNQVYPNQNAAEFDETTAVTSFDSDGFTMGSYSGINQSGADYIYLAFKENPSTTVVPAGEMSYLVAAGGAGGGAMFGGGGGAGGLRTSFGTTSGGGASAESNITLSAGTYTITIGAGGSGVTSSTGTQGNNGSASSISGGASVSTVGGGGGGTYVTNTSQLPGLNGGSGGGGGALGQTSPYISPKGTGTANEGFDGADGGFGSFNGTVGPGGGGGAGALGVASSSGYRVGGNGGAGLAVNIVPGGVFAGGGAGGGEGGAGIGGIGGGGKGGVASSYGGANGITNTGSGGGGCGNNGAALTSGNGGSGVVILRMRTSDYSGSTTGSPLVRAYGDETILTFTGSGTYVHS